ncbi:hypothetical protein [Bacteroides caccae]|uniref:hypothetical protein n=1 Tax=Bacteroides caccae TaxID=47678 RepID=UPI00123149C6
MVHDPSNHFPNHEQVHEIFLASPAVWTVPFPAAVMHDGQLWKHGSDARGRCRHWRGRSGCRSCHWGGRPA